MSQQINRYEPSPLPPLLSISSGNGFVDEKVKLGDSAHKDSNREDDTLFCDISGSHLNDIKQEYLNAYPFYARNKQKQSGIDKNKVREDSLSQDMPSGDPDDQQLLKFLKQYEEHMDESGESQQLFEQYNAEPDYFPETGEKTPSFPSFLDGRMMMKPAPDATNFSENLSSTRAEACMNGPAYISRMRPQCDQSLNLLVDDTKALSKKNSRSGSAVPNEDAHRITQERHAHMHFLLQGPNEYGQPSSLNENFASLTSETNDISLDAISPTPFLERYLSGFPSIGESHKNYQVKNDTNAGNQVMEHFNAPSIAGVRHSRGTVDVLNSDISSSRLSLSALKLPEKEEPSSMRHNELNFATHITTSRENVSSAQGKSTSILSNPNKDFAPAFESTLPKMSDEKTGNISCLVRPLNAYNFFFSDERERILSGNAHEVLDAHKKQRLLMHHRSKDRSARRKHRKTHGKIDFKTLTREIGQRWKRLPIDQKKFYEDVAASDMKRYKAELDLITRETIMS